VNGPHAWRLETIDGLTLVRSELLAAVTGVAHAFSTRLADGGQDFDLGRADEAGPPWDERRRRLCEAAGLAGQLPAMMLQVHGDRLLVAGEPGAPDDEPPRADGILALRRPGDGVVAAVRIADCVPLLIADREGAAVAAVHAGWRGTAQGIVRHAVDRLAGLGLGRSNLVAALGPAIGPCCYEVGDEVVEKVAAASGLPASGLARPGGNGRFMLDLHRANRIQLEAAGLLPIAISAAPWCTSCRPERFYSSRQQGAAAGRMLACIGWGSSRASP